MLRLVGMLGLARAWGLVLHLGSAGSGIFGEVCAGFIMGPNSQNVAPYQEGLQGIGLLGVFLAAFEDGLYTDLDFFQFVTLPSFLVGTVAPALSVGLGIVALNAVGIGWIEASCASVALAAAVPGRARVRWDRTRWQECGVLRDQVGQVISVSTCIATLVALTTIAVVKGMAKNESSGIRAWGVWDLVQPAIVSVGLIVISVILRLAVTSADAGRVLSQISGKATRSGMGGGFVVVMLAVAVGMIIFAEVLRSTSILGAYCAGIVFSGIPGARVGWEHNTRNIVPWLLKVYLACTVGFTIPLRTWVWKEDALAGFFVGIVAIFGKVLGGAMASLPFLGGVEVPLRVAQSLQIGTAMSIHGHIGIFALTQISARGLLEQISDSAVLWGLLYGSLLGPAMFEAACQLEIKTAEMQNTDPERELDLPYPAVSVKELPHETVGLESVEVGTPAKDMRANVLKYQRVAEPAPSPYTQVPDNQPYAPPQYTDVAPAPYAPYVANGAPAYTEYASAPQYPQNVPAGYSLVVPNAQTFEPPSTIIDRQNFYPQKSSPVEQRKVTRHSSPMSP
jgi:Kef-type K+ transport system membrane component KefB